MDQQYALSYITGGVLQGGQIGNDLNALKQQAFETYRDGFDDDDDCYIMGADGEIVFNMDTDTARTEADDYYAATSLNDEAEQLAATYGYWDEHPQYPVSDWQQEVKEGATKTGYWEWVAALQSDDAVV